MAGSPGAAGAPSEHGAERSEQAALAALGEPGVTLDWVPNRASFMSCEAGEPCSPWRYVAHDGRIDLQCVRELINGKLPKNVVVKQTYQTKTRLIVIYQQLPPSAGCDELIHWLEVQAPGSSFVFSLTPICKVGRKPRKGNGSLFPDIFADVERRCVSK